MKKVAVVGTSKIDIFLGGMNSWPSRPAERSRVEQLTYRVGGNGLNVARHLAGMGGIEVTLFTAHGHHAQGKTIHAALKYLRPIPHENPQDAFDNPVTAVIAEHDGRLHTGVSIIHIDDDNEPQIASYSGVSDEITLDFLQPQVNNIQECDFLYFGGVGTSTGLSFNNVSAFLSDVRKGENTPSIMADVNLISGLNQNIQDAIAAIAPVLQHVDYFVPNETEAVQYSGGLDVVKAAAAFNCNVRKATIIKRGSQGVGIYIKDKAVQYVLESEVAAHEIVNTLGAGDTWCAGFIAQILQDENDIEKACVFANKVAAFSIKRTGASSNLHNFGWYNSNEP